MWSKLSNALKSRADPEESALDSQPSNFRQGDVMSKVLEQHPNLSVFHTASEISLPRPSPPSSPSKHGRLGLFKRVKPPKSDEMETSSTLRLPLGKKFRTPLQINASGSTISLQPPSSDLRRTSLEIPRPSDETLPETPNDLRKPFGSVRSILRDKNTPGTGQSVRFFSRDVYRVISPDQSLTSNNNPEPTFLQRLQEASPEPFSKVEETRYYSPVTSPGDFFSPPPHPPQSATASDRSPSPIEFARMQTSREMSSPLVTIPPPDLSNIFDLSQEHDVMPIPLNEDAMLQDNAVEVTEYEEIAAEEGRMSAEAGSEPNFDSSKDSTDVLEQSRSLGRKAGEKVFSSMTTATANLARMRSSSSLNLQKLFNNTDGGKKSKETRSSSGSSSSNRSRSMSESLLQHPIAEGDFLTDITRPPEMDINDESASRIVLYGGPETPDPFRIDATTYFTPEARISNSPPRFHHTKTNSSTSAASRSITSHISSRYDDPCKDEVLHMLRTQLALQQELSKQYEIDLFARDELVMALQSKLQCAEEDANKRRNVVRGWKKKVAELEKVCRNLEEEVNDSRQESFERSIMDEASGEALRELHRQISHFKSEKSEAEKREAALVEEKVVIQKSMQAKEQEVETLRDALKRKEMEEKMLEDGIQQAKDELNLMGTHGDTREDLKTSVIRAEQAYAEEQERHHAAEFAWEEEKEQLFKQIQAGERERDAMAVDVAEIRDKLLDSENEITTLKRELEVQWKITEGNGEKLEQVEKERDGLRSNLEALETRATEMELEWTESENRKAAVESELNELWNYKEQVEKERDQLTDELNAERDEVEKLTQQIQAHTDEMDLLQQERQFDVERLETLLRERDAELAKYTEKTVGHQDAAEQLRSELSRLTREHTRIVDEQRRKYDDVVTREESARKTAEESVKAKAEADVLTNTLKEQLTSLKEDIEKLRRQIHDLKQESADKEVKLMQFEKRHQQDKEDKLGLNIALDSKQQELELLKRKMGVRGTAGSTPAPPSRTTNRRESSLFNTPSIRPPSAMSDLGKESKQVETPTIAKPFTLGKSTRANNGLSSSSSTATPSTMKAPRFTDMGPPTSKPRASMASSASSTSSINRRPSVSVSRSVSAKPSAGVATSSATVHRRTSSALMRSEAMSDTSSVQDDKENTKPSSTKIPTPSSSRRLSTIPAVPA